MNFFASGVLLLTIAGSSMGCMSDRPKATPMASSDAAMVVADSSVVPAIGRVSLEGALTGYDLHFRQAIISSGATQPDADELSYTLLFSSALTSCAGGGPFATGMRWRFTGYKSGALTPGIYHPTSDSTVRSAQHGIDLDVVLAMQDANCSSGEGIYLTAGSTITLDSVTDSAASGAFEFNVPIDAGISKLTGTFAAERCSGYPYHGCQ
jgi:hypothetical protein